MHAVRGTHQLSLPWASMSIGWQHLALQHSHELCNKAKVISNTTVKVMSLLTSSIWVGRCRHKEKACSQEKYSHCNNFHFCLVGDRWSSSLWGYNEWMLGENCFAIFIVGWPASGQDAHLLAWGHGSTLCITTTVKSYFYWIRLVHAWWMSVFIKTVSSISSPHAIIDMLSC